MKRNSGQGSGSGSAASAAPASSGGAPDRPAFEIGGATVAAGERASVRIRVARLPAGGRLSLPIHVIHGASPGPVLFLSGAIHGDEVDGVEITRQVLHDLRPEELAGTLLAAPVVNLPGLLAGSRYLPDRRDLNRSFPGSPTGSLAARLAHLFMTEVVERCSHGIDYHCGSDDRENLPQVRANLDDDETRRLARAFAAPVTIHAPSPEGSLRRAAVERGTRVILYEAGEARRFTNAAVRAGVAGTLNVMAALGMTGGATPGADGDGPDAAAATVHATAECRTRRWVRAPRSGVCRLDVELGERVEEDQVLGEVTNALGRETAPVRSRASGIVIGRRVNPIVFQGEALVHIAVLAGEDAPGGS